MIVATGNAPPGNTVLIVDDEQGIRTFVSHVLRCAGFETVMAADGREAIEKFRAVAPQLALVVLDVALPAMRGSDLLLAMRAVLPALPAVVISGHPGETVRPDFGALDHVAFLRKPFGMAALQAEVARLLATS